MKNSFGQSVSLSVFGESHGSCVGALLSGMAPGIGVDEEYIKARLALRRGIDGISTARREEDAFEIKSGVFEGKTTGTPICITVPNGDTRSRDYAKTRFLARPSHADYTAFAKYHGYEDYRGGGHFSGRITAGVVAAGAIAQSALEGIGVLIGTHVKRCAGVDDAPFCDFPAEIKALEGSAFGVIDGARGEAMKDAILKAAAEGDSVGGVLETAIYGLPAGIGEPWFDSLESVLAHALFSIPAVKGVEFGAGFALADMRGSEANDAFFAEDGAVRTRTNNSGGINGGISNGMPLVVRCAVRPTPSIYKEQQTVDISTGENARLLINGRHDPAIVHRARVVADSLAAVAVCDMIAQRFGTDALKG